MWREHHIFGLTKVLKIGGQGREIEEFKRSFFVLQHIEGGAQYMAVL